MQAPAVLPPAKPDEPHPDTWTRTNLVGVPAPLLASPAFNAHPVPLHIAGTRPAQPGPFALLDAAAGPAEAAEVFEHFMALAFGLQQPPPPTPGARRWRASYLRLLQGRAWTARAWPARC